MKFLKSIPRRNFIKSALLASGTIGLTSIPPIGSSRADTLEDRSNIIGPIDGYPPHIGTIVSMLTWMRAVILTPVAGMTTKQLDYLHDEKSNSIGAMLLHLAATERFYQIHTFEGKKWGDWSERDKDRFEVAIYLGEEARKP